MTLLDNEPIPQQRRHLVIIRGGARALHYDWTLPDDRQWDLITLAYDNTLMSSEGIPAGVTVGDWLVDSRASSSKFFGLQAFFEQHPEALNYASVLMPDDDLLFDPRCLNEMFALFEQSGAAVGQPALTWDSYISHFVTYENKAFLYRYTNFAEVMTPMMTGETLRRMLPTFTANKSSWGFDMLWAKLSADLGQRVVIIDKTPVKHTRPVGGGGLYAALGVDPAVECAELLAKYQVPAVASCVMGGVINPAFGAPRSGLLIESYIAGLNATVMQHPAFVHTFRASLPHLISV
jgi:hypothetical protein